MHCFFVFAAAKTRIPRYSGISRYQEKNGLVRPYWTFRVLTDNPKGGQGGNSKRRMKKKLRKLRPQPDAPPVPGLSRPGPFKPQLL
jgi:hypothetical protein